MLIGAFWLEFVIDGGTMDKNTKAAKIVTMARNVEIESFETNN